MVGVAPSAELTGSAATCSPPSSSTRQRSPSMARRRGRGARLFSPMNWATKLFAGARRDLVGRRELLDRAVVEHRDAVRHGQRLGLVVGDVDDGDAEPLVDVLDLELHLLAQLLVERAERLVHQHELGLEDQRAGKRDALLLAAGELAGPAVAACRQLHHVEGALDLARRSRPSGTCRTCSGKARFSRDGHVREQGIVLEHHADVALVRRRRC